MVLEGIARDKGTRPRQKAAAAGPDVLRLMLATSSFPATPLGARDRALLLIGFGAALRRSELAGPALGDVTPAPGRGLACSCAAPRPTSAVPARRSPSGPTQGSQASARPPPSRPGASSGAKGRTSWAVPRTGSRRSSSTWGRRPARSVEAALRTYRGTPPHQAAGSARQ